MGTGVGDTWAIPAPLAGMGPLGAVVAGAVEEEAAMAETEAPAVSGTVNQTGGAALAGTSMPPPPSSPPMCPHSHLLGPPALQGPLAPVEPVPAWLLAAPTRRF